MNKRQLNAIAYNYTRLRHKRELEFLTATNRLEDYNKSKYKTPTTYILHNNLNREYVEFCKKNGFKVY